eukprot:CAMPEP_0196146568 /NCGR_PEP_ID=MMETSP0910-20130528/23322_1 /TAXON_ID=49265 /ORGANISM="Thalassiosira rotula, Strain GSO102" /LENGTH=102 /DNA_ID=CAMNT_0041408785 /DNA_START=20 /DNA_END=325 /DNA_ORIENTATION=-
MAEHDPFPMRSEEARRLAASVENPDDDDYAEDNNDQYTDGGSSSRSSWNKMGTSLSQKLPKAFKKGNKHNDGMNTKVSLVGGSTKKKKKNKKKKSGAEESIY